MKFTVRAKLNSGLILSEVFPPCLEHHHRLFLMPSIFVARTELKIAWQPNCWSGSGQHYALNHQRVSILLLSVGKMFVKI